MAQKITTMLWFNGQAEEAAKFYCSVFKNAKMGAVMRRPPNVPGPGDALTASFTIDGREFTGLNGGPHFTFNESVSFVVHCKDQAEVDYYWDKFLASGGKPSACGWLKDQFGVSWQITPQKLMDLNVSGEPKKVQAMMGAMMTMVKLDMPALQKAYDEG
jgi:predicted 3-demethylubiquinone-9 3-methyltransferase (glyoxalase superfamily)